MLGSVDLIRNWFQLASDGEAHASVRFGDASNTILAHDTVLTMDFIKSHYGWLNDPTYCGITLPNTSAREIIVHCLRKADYVGHLIQTDHWYFKPLFDMCLAYYKVEPRETFYAFENNYIARFKLFYETFKTMPILLCGAKAEQYREVLERRYGWTSIVGTVDCPSWSHVSTASKQMEHIYQQTPWKLALVCAGAPGKVLVIKAKELQTVGVDFGSGADVAIQADSENLNAWDYNGFPDYWEGRPKK
ncbi:GT-D fold domain-containing glycosyltransferase [Paenibacillus sp. ClWae2A]|uniref:GT-D fold domain-containing protein n=1 Tax=Paenibacillus sp. ClWae2A TaxID=3057177 RepID=UPI0028F5EA2D|nr:GT-D fold domain-containing glycosyltransferase [Paenibacillus sp. ClWae2A]MDT9719513.1 GT-D fold domain-containing glycosyltransferase [Paenibacillus sp. ClWae2A]